MDQIVDFLSKIPPFNRLAPQFLQTLSAYVKLETVAAGTPLVESGTPINHLRIVLHGKVAVSKKTSQGLVWRSEGPGAIIGMLELFGDNTASYTARTEEDSIMLMVAREDFQNLLKARPEEAVLLMDLLSRQTKAVTPRPIRIKNKETAEEDSKTSKTGAGTSPESDESPFFLKRFTCPFCETEFPSVEVKSKFIKVEKTDSDYCPHYRDVNPLFYEVRVCPRCGYAFTAEMPAVLSDRARTVLAARLSKLRTPLRFGGERDLNAATEAFRLAFYCLEAIGGGNALLGKLYLKIAWLHRYAGEREEDREYSEKALFCLIESYRLEKSTDAASELKLLYLIAELSYRLENYNLAAQWFGRILNHPQRSTNPGIIKRTRDRWYDLREKLKNASQSPVEQ
ncbi:MAG: DUF2225 domain-containing protein [Bacillota bacterium]